MNNEKSVFILLGIMFLVGIVMIFFAWNSLDVGSSGTSLEIMRDNHIGDRSSQMSPAIVTTALSGISSSVQIVPLLIAVVLFGSMSVGLYTLFKKEKSKPRVAFVKGRDAKKLDPDAWRKKKDWERAQVRALRRETRGLDDELTDLARIAKVNALGGMSRGYSGGFVNNQVERENPFLSEDE